jgi:tRNA(Ile2)-agmatinylcytidine synthase
MKQDLLHIGIDDTDSPRGGCTTYIGALLVERLSKLGLRFIDYPNLVRLNPNVPWKTRGNGAVSLRVLGSQEAIQRAREAAIATVEEESDFDWTGTDPGLVFFYGELPQELVSFSHKAIQGLVTMREAISLIKHFGAEAIGYKEGRGIIGALAAVGERLQGDHTYELIAYRKKENRGLPRRVDEASVRAMNRETYPETFNNIDVETGRILLTPRGPDPVLYGIRGESPEAVYRAHKMIRVYEEIERWAIFRTNHGTDSHLRSEKQLSEAKPYMPIMVHGRVTRAPRRIEGRHVIFSITDGTQSIDCAAYEPTGAFRRIVEELIEGDLVEVCGGVRPPSKNHSITINLEKLRILRLAPKYILENPLCPSCGRRMKSMGKGKGFRCDVCGFKDRKAKKLVKEMARSIEEGIYITPPRCHRHLTKPLIRYGKEKIGPLSSNPEILGFHLFKPWHEP